MKQQQGGFTLIELVAVIVILGALAVVALPRFVNLQDDAQTAALEGVAGGLASAAAVNYAAYIADDQSISGSNNAVQINDCDLAVFNDAMQSPIDTNDYSLTGSAPSASGDSFTCTLTGPNGNTTTFNAVAVS